MNDLITFKNIINEENHVHQIDYYVFYIVSHKSMAGHRSESSRLNCNRILKKFQIRCVFVNGLSSLYGPDLTNDGRRRG